LARCVWEEVALIPCDCSRNGLTMVDLPSICVLIYRGKAREITSRGCYNERGEKEGAIVILIWVRWCYNVKPKLYMKQTPNNSISNSNYPNRVHKICVMSFNNHDLHPEETGDKRQCPLRPLQLQSATAKSGRSYSCLLPSMS
jgi:hypothetical protein